MEQVKQEAVNQQANQLPAFTEVIKIEIEVQAIYQKLMDTFPEDYKHKEILSHAIIGSAPRLDYIYNALSGYTNTIDFKVGDVVICTEEEKWEWYDANKEDKDGNPINTVREVGEYKPDMKQREVAIGKCVIEKIDVYSSNKLTVTFEGATRYDEKIRTMKTSVNHKNCTKWYAA